VPCRAKAARGQFARLDPQVDEVIHGKTEAPLGQRREAFMLHRPHAADRILGELEHQ
jgi:hypothetical protein